MKLELIPVPVSDIDRAKDFYADNAGFTVDVDMCPADGVRIVQLTPPGSACSILLSRGLPTLNAMKPGTVQGVHLVVPDIQRARAELTGRGVETGKTIDKLTGGAHK